MLSLSAGMGASDAKELTHTFATFFILRCVSLNVHVDTRIFGSTLLVFGL